MNTIVALYIVGLVFHAYCAYMEVRYYDRAGVNISLLEHLRATALLILWPWVPLTILFHFYVDRLDFYAQPPSPNR